MLYSTRPLQVKKKMMMRENNMLNAPGALLHSTSIGSPPLLLERRFTGNGRIPCFAYVFTEVLLIVAVGLDFPLSLLHCAGSLFRWHLAYSNAKCYIAISFP